MFIYPVFWYSQARIADPKLATACAKYDGLSTERLLALRDSRQQDLLHGPWNGAEGASALRFVTELVGLVNASSADSASSSNDGTGVKFDSSQAGAQLQVRALPHCFTSVFSNWINLGRR